MAILIAAATLTLSQLNEHRAQLTEEARALSALPEGSWTAEQEARAGDLADTLEDLGKRQNAASVRERMVSAAAVRAVRDAVANAPASERALDERAKPSYRNAWDRWMAGRGPAPSVPQEIREGVIASTNSGIWVPLVYEENILKYRDAQAVIRNKAELKTGLRGKPSIRVNTQVDSDYTAMWTAESPTATDVTADLAAVDFPPILGYPTTRVSTTVLVQSDFDVEGEVMDDLMRKLSKGKEYSYTQGVGTTTPKGCMVTDANTNQLTVTAAHGGGTGWDGALTAANLKTLCDEKLPAAAWPGAEWYIGQTAYAKIGALVDSNQRFILSTDTGGGAAQGRGLTLLGYPVNVVPFAPARQTAASTSVPVIFGNLREAFRVGEWEGMGMLRDEITVKGRVIFTLQPFAQSAYTRPKNVAQLKVVLT